MSIACWNVRGFHNPNRMKEVKHLINKFKISCFGVLENKLSFSDIKKLEKNVDYGWKIISNVSCYYKCRILVFIDGNSWDYNYISMSEQHITLELINISSFKCNISFVYAQNHEKLRKRLWTNLQEDAISIFRPWLVLGDFNCIRSPTDKKGGNPVAFGNLFELEDMSRYTGLNEINIKGYEFSWWSGASRNIFSKIDRVFANLEWINSFSDFSAEYIPPSVKDHNAIVVSLYSNRRDKNRPFKYMNFWTMCDQYFPLIEKLWKSNQEDRPLYQIIYILMNIKRELKLWSAKLRNTKSEVKEQRENCSRLQ